MTVKHTNSGEEIDLSLPHYYKWNSQNGYLLVATNQRVYFMYTNSDSHEIDYEDLTDEFELPFSGVHTM